MTLDEIRKKVWDIDIVVEEIKEFPQTYETILAEGVKDGTCQTILRRKLNRLCKEGTVFKTTIPGTRFGKAIFYVNPKTYYILVEGGRLGVDVYVFFKFEKISKFYIRVKKHWQLSSGRWVLKKQKTFFEGNVLKWI